jgi:hypothetical protein
VFSVLKNTNKLNGAVHSNEITTLITTLSNKGGLYWNYNIIKKSTNRMAPPRCIHRMSQHAMANIVFLNNIIISIKVTFIA